MPKVREHFESTPCPRGVQLEPRQASTAEGAHGANNYAAEMSETLIGPFNGILVLDLFKTPSFAGNK